MEAQAATEESRLGHRVPAQPASSSLTLGAGHQAQAASHCPFSHFQSATLGTNLITFSPHSGS